MGVVDANGEQRSYHFKSQLKTEFRRPVDLGIESTLKPAVRETIARNILYV